MEDKVKQNKFSVKKKHWIWIILALLILAGATIYFIWQYLNQPAIGDVQVVEQKQDADKPLFQEKERFEGKYVSFAHYSSYVEKSHEIAEDEQSNILESAFFAQQDINSKKIALTVEKLSGGNMENSANYKLRATYPERYRQSEFYQNGIRGVEFSADGDQGNEKVFFVQRENILVILAITGFITGDEESETEAKELAGSLTFSFR